MDAIQSKTKVNEVMSTDIAYCLEDQAVDEAVILMEARQIRRLPIVKSRQTAGRHRQLGGHCGTRRRPRSDRRNP